MRKPEDSFLVTRYINLYYYTDVVVVVVVVVVVTAATHDAADGVWVFVFHKHFACS